MLCINSIDIVQQWLKPYCIAPPAYPKNQLKPPQIRPDFSTRNPYGSTGHLTGLSLWRMPRSAYLKKCVRVPYWVKPVSSSADHLALVRTRLTTFFSVENHLGGGSLPQDGLSTFMIYINIHNSRGVALAGFMEGLSQTIRAPINLVSIFRVTSVGRVIYMSFAYWFDNGRPAGRKVVHSCCCC